MANLPDDRLPDEFEVVVQGTGLTQSILAAAAARIGKSVLQLDGNSFYGELWGSLMHRELDAWLLHDGDGDDIKGSHPNTVDPEPLSSDERSIELVDGAADPQVLNAVEFIPERSQKLSDAPQPNTSPTLKEEGTDDAEPLTTDTPAVNTPQPNTSPTLKEEGTDDADTPGFNTAQTDTSPLSDGEDEKLSMAATSPDDPSVSWESLGCKKQRRFNYDLFPKLLYCRGDMVNLIVDSGVSRYMEFKAVSKLYLYTSEDSFVQVPSSRSDVFSSKIVSMLDKRKLMKFLSFCSEYDQHPDQYKGYEDKTFREFLRSSQGLGDILSDFVIYSIAFADNATNTIKGLEFTQLFLQSLGRFGNAPFIYPIFGVGELPQAFCRLCAVFGGVYCLKRSVKSIITEDGNVKGIICTSGQRIKCSRVISSAVTLRHHLPVGAVRETIVSRAIFIANGSVTRNEEGKIGVVTVPPGLLGEGQKSKIQLIQCDSTTLNTAEGTYMVHAVYESEDISALKTLADRLYSNITASGGDTPTPSGDTPTPALLRALYYKVKLYEVVGRGAASSALPDTVSITSDPDPSISFECCVKEAKAIFDRTFPGEDFLPKIPEPEEIVYEDYQPPEVNDEGGDQNEDNGNHDDKDTAGDNLKSSSHDDEHDEKKA